MQVLLHRLGRGKKRTGSNISLAAAVNEPSSSHDTPRKQLFLSDEAATPLSADARLDELMADASASPDMPAIVDIQASDLALARVQRKPTFSRPMLALPAGDGAPGESGGPATDTVEAPLTAEERLAARRQPAEHWIKLLCEENIFRGDAMVRNIERAEDCIKNTSKFDMTKAVGVPYGS